MANRPMASPTLVLVVPCFNEEARLDRQAFLDFASSHPQTRLLFVNDGSDDGTPGILDGMRTQAPGALDVIHLPVNQGKAAAVREGVLAGLRRAPDLVGFWDADLSTPLTAVSDFEITSFANSITLTPGTISVHVSDDRKVIVMHAIDVGDDLDGLRQATKDSLEAPILRFTREERRS